MENEEKKVEVETKENTPDTNGAPQYENVSILLGSISEKEKSVKLADIPIIKTEYTDDDHDDHEGEMEPSEKDRLKGEDVEQPQMQRKTSFLVPVEMFEGDPAHTVEGQVAFMTNSQRNLAANLNNRRISTISNKALGWKRYLGLIYTLISTNMFSLSSNVLKLMGHIHPLNLGAYAFPMGAVLSAPFIWYTLKVEKKSVTANLFPLREHKKVAFFMWFRATVSILISYGLIASFQYITVADTRTILAASVITVNFLGCILLGEKCGAVPIVVAIMALCGIGVMTRPPVLTGAESFDNDTLIGVSLAFGCMILATIIILSLRFLQNVHHGVLNTFLYTWAFVATLPIGIFMGKVGIPENPWDIFGMLGVGVLWSLGNTFLVLALQVEEAGVVALLRTSEVIFTFFWQMVILGIYPDLISLIGAVLVLTGVIVVTLRKWIASLDKDSTLRKRLAFLLL